MSVSTKLIPGWLAGYSRGKLGADVAAGLIVTVLVIPQSLAYALLAGLPPQTGLYVSIFPVIAYALLGSSMVQAVGPVAITAIMTYSVLTPLAAPGSPQYVAFAATLSLISGVMVLACGFMRLGFLSQLLSRPVISGFISGSAILIVISQMKYLLGVTSDGGNGWELALDLLTKTPQVHGPTAAIGLTALAALIFVKAGLTGLLLRVGMDAGKAAFVGRLMPLAVVLFGTLAVVHWDLDTRSGVPVVGAIVEGLPAFTFFLPGYDAISPLIKPAFVLTLVGMVQNLSMAQALAIKRRERVDANAELVGLGAANVVAAFYGGMPVGGGVSRSAVNVAAGARTPLASIVSALAMIAVVAAYSMIDVGAFRRAWAYDRADGLALLGTAGGVLAFGLEVGIGMGVLLSTATLLLRASTPHIAVVGRIPGSEHFRNVARHSVETIPGALFVRIDERLFFGNLGAVELRLNQELEKVAGIRDLVLVMSAVNLMDATAVEVLCELNRDLAGRRIRLHLAEVKGPIQDRLMRTGLWSTLSGEVFLSANDAFEKLGRI